jgi:multiple sugar transport system permease protein
MQGNSQSRISLPKSESLKKKYWTGSRKETLLGWLFIAPETIGIVVLGAFPLLFSLYLSFTDWDLVSGLKGINYVGFDNYIQLFQESKFYITLKNNLMYTAATVPLSIIIALVIAVVIHSVLYFKGYFKVVFFIPYIATTVAVAAVFSVLFHPSQGVINNLLMSFGIMDPPKWLGSTDFALWSIIIIAVWQVIGYNVVIYLAGLTAIPDDLYEAAEIDGANKWKQFTRITVPMLGTTTFFLTITSVINSFKVFDLVAFLTGGGPRNATNVLVYYLYEEGFQKFRMGYAATLSWVLFIVIGIITLLTVRMQRNQY